MAKKNLNKNKSIEAKNTSSERSTDMDGALIRCILSEELEHRDYVTKLFLSEELEHRDYVTKLFLSEELERRDYVTKPYLHEEMTAQRKEYERYIGALSEDFQSKLDAITEIVVATAEDMTSIKDWIKEDHYNTHITINTRLAALESSSPSIA